MLDNVRPEAALGLGIYSFAEAARLLRLQKRTVTRWLVGYSFHRAGEYRQVQPLWLPDFRTDDGKCELSFKDLIELRFVAAFVAHGLSLSVVRRCHDYAKLCLGTDRPFLEGKFKTDGETIFLDGNSELEKKELLDLKRNQYVIREVVQSQFRDLDSENEIVVRWRPFNGKPSIVIDPKRSFGRPIAEASGVPTAALAAAVNAERSVKLVSRQFEVPEAVVRDAVKFQQALEAA